MNATASSAGALRVRFAGRGLPCYLPDMALADDIAQTILDGFDKHYRLFRQVSIQAQDRFERRAWGEVQAESRNRIAMYDERVRETVEEASRRFPQDLADDSHWPSIKQAYIALLYDHHQPELAETFFNSVACRVLRRTYYNNEYIFWRPAVAAESIEAEQPVWRSYETARTSLRPVLGKILADFVLRSPLAEPKREIRLLLRAIRSWLGPSFRRGERIQIEVLSSLFFRNRAAYVVGRVVQENQPRPFAVALRHHEDGIHIDALIQEREHLSGLFSLAHVYFMVDMEVPSAWVGFLQAMLPDKSKAELYTALGLQKQGKNLFYRELNAHLKHSHDQFVVAPGTRGMVMVVFTLPSFPYVFKCIRDRFDPPKDTSREEVKAKYLLVKRHDRIGRMVDTLEYTDVALPLHRFAPALVEEMERRIPSLLERDGERLVIRHVYIEKRLAPMDLYLRDAIERGDEERLLRGVDELGGALRDMAAVNIFPGDLLPKNFGLTRNGRLVFYDFDEISYLTDCNFRRLPTATRDDEETSAEPWYSVAANDVFPEEFITFLFPPGRARDLFCSRHGELLDPAFWIVAQERIRAGTEPELFPYPERIRLGAAGR